MALPKEQRLVARCGLCERRRSLTLFIAAKNGRRVCGQCWLDVWMAMIERQARNDLTLALMDGEPVPNPHYALRRVMETPGWCAT